MSEGSFSAAAATRMPLMPSAKSAPAKPSKARLLFQGKLPPLDAARPYNLSERQWRLLLGHLHGATFTKLARHEAVSEERIQFIVNQAALDAAWILRAPELYQRSAALDLPANTPMRVAKRCAAYNISLAELLGEVRSRATIAESAAELGVSLRIFRAWLSNFGIE